jgi:hypothetical protein
VPQLQAQRLADWRDIAEPDHSVELYESDTLLLDGLARFIGGAMDAGDPAVVIATPEHGASLRERLTVSHADSVARAERAGRFITLDAADTLSRFMVYGHPDRSKFLTSVGVALAGAAECARTPGGQVAAFGEMVALLWADGNATAALELEGLWNELAESYAFYLHCAYPSTLFLGAGDARAFTDMCGHHSKIIGDIARAMGSSAYTCPYCWYPASSMDEWTRHCALRHPQRSLRVARPISLNGGLRPSLSPDD